MFVEHRLQIIYFMLPKILYKAGKLEKGIATEPMKWDFLAFKLFRHKLRPLSVPNPVKMVILS